MTGFDQVPAVEVAGVRVAVRVTVAAEAGYELRDPWAAAFGRFV